ncbi:acetyl-CoA synthetase-like protein [Cubamyces lactineus]|nr:acetyl-CoA synthetase-like protein [Cubamyces lactineus]
MSTIEADGGPLPPIPDDLSVADFILNRQHPLRPSPNCLHPLLIEESTGRQIGSDELRARIFGLANSLKLRWDIGEAFDVVSTCLFSPNHVDFVVAMWAVQRLGAVITTANPSFTAEELAYQLETARATLLFVHAANLQVALEASRASGISPERIILFDPAPEGMSNIQDLVIQGLREEQRFSEYRFQPGEGRTKPAVLCFSSGTTGRPKAVAIPHYSIIANLIQLGQYLHLTDGTIPPEELAYRPGGVANSTSLFLSAVLPFYHVYGLHMVLFSSLWLGSAVVVSQKFQLERMLESIQRYRITHLYLVPPMAIRLCKSAVINKYDLSSVYFFMVGAAPVSAELTDQLVRVLPKNCRIGQGYGMTEMANIISFLQLDQRVGTLGSAGVLVPGVTARVVKSDGTLAGFNELGELHLKSPSMSLGYLNNPKANTETFKDGWLHTGDEVMINERKEVFITDRIKELIKVRGFQVAPAELEGHLLTHPDVAESCVVGIPDQYSGELPFAFIVLRPDASARIQRVSSEEAKVRADVIEYVGKHKVYYKRLAGVEFVNTVPKTPSGKLLRRHLRDKAKEMLAKEQLKFAVKPKL